MCRGVQSLGWGVAALCVFGFSATALSAEDRLHSFERNPWDTPEDRVVLGNQSSFCPPARWKALGEAASTESYTARYSGIWKGSPHYQKSCWGCKFYGRLTELVKFHTVLDAGCGNGMAVRMLRELGKNAYGVELSDAVQQQAKDLMDQGFVEQGSLREMPYANNSFDAVVSGDVLEHLNDDIVDDVISELVRVSRKHILMSISLKDTFDGLHTMLRPREWWHAKFRKHGAVVNEPLVAIFQKNMAGVFPTPVPRKCVDIGSATDGGKYPICEIDDPWLVGLNYQNILRKEKWATVTTGEIEPWFFMFRKVTPADGYGARTGAADPKHCPKPVAPATPPSAPPPVRPPVRPAAVVRRGSLPKPAVPADIRRFRSSSAPSSEEASSRSIDERYRSMNDRSDDRTTDPTTERSINDPASRQPTYIRRKGQVMMMSRGG